MKVCEHCGKSFPNQLYNKHKYTLHQQSLFLYNHLGSERARGKEESKETLYYII